MTSPRTILQAFYWDCPRIAGVEHAWWPHVARQVEHLADAGITALWLPPASKSMQTASMGYDPYDYYDLGDLPNKGHRPETWFGSRADLEALIAVAHVRSLEVIADLVFNHNSGGDELERNEIDGAMRWTRFTPKSGRFPRDWRSFHPSPYETSEGLEDFAGMPDLCHRNPDVFAEIMRYAAWLVEEIGFDGFRYDMVKAYGAWIVTALQEYRYSKPGAQRYGFRISGVAECWESTRFVREWLAQANHWSDNDVRAFDFETRGRLRDLCDRDGASLRALMAPGSLALDDAEHAVTFVENHDVHRPGDERHHHPIVRDKLLAYAFILALPADACIFWKDWFEYGLALPGTPHGLDALTRLRSTHARGELRERWLDDTLLVLERGDSADAPGMVLVLNTSDAWRGATVTTRWPSAHFTPRAWWGRDDRSRPQEKGSDTDGRVELWAAGRGFAVWVASR